MSKPGPPLLRYLKYVGIGLCLPLLLWTLLPLAGPVWHAFTGDNISYQGWRVSVPKGFFAWVPEKVPNAEIGPTFWRVGIGGPWIHHHYGHISLFSYPRPFQHDQDYPNFEKGLILDANRKGFQLKSRVTVPVGSGLGYCLEFEGPEQERLSLVRCAIGDSPVALFYEGDQKYVPDFFAMLRSMAL